MFRVSRIADRVLGRFHRNESGAVVFAAFAACFILFMLGLVLYDTGKNVRNKIDVQTAADVAAYSQMSVKARSMNMLAFTNIGKRTLVGVHNMYWGQMMGYSAWVASECARCCCSWKTPWCCVQCPCRNCWGNTPLLTLESFTDFFSFSGLPVVMPLILGGESKSVFAAELEALQTYQEYMVEVTPWWGWSEQLIRGARNGATVTTSFPPPPDPLTVGIDIFEQVMNFFGFSIWSQTRMTDSLPVSRDDGMLGRMESCSPPMPMFSVMTLGSAAEVEANLRDYKNRSSKGPFIACEGPGSNKPSSMGLAMAASTACMMSTILSPIADYMAPYHLTNSGGGLFGGGGLPESAQDLLLRSNIIFAYKHDTENMGFGRERLDMSQQDYSTNVAMTGVAMTNPTLRSAGLWAFSRAELIHPSPAIGTGPHGTWMWHAGWTAKLRPMVLDNEFTQLGGQIAYGGNSALNAMFHDVAPYLSAGAALMGLLGGGDFDFTQAMWDFYFMEKATRTMDDDSASGLPQ